MDRKSIAVLVVSFLMLLMLPHLANRIWPPVKVPQKSQQTAASTNSAAQTPSTNAAAQAPAPAPVLAAAPERRPLVSTNIPEQIQVLENDEARYIFTSHGGGVARVQLKKYPAVVTCDRQNPETNRVELNSDSDLPIMAILGPDAIQGDGVFQLSKTAAGLTAQKQFTNGLRLVKEYRIATNQLLEVTVRLQNGSDRPLSLPAQEWILGSASALGSRDDPTRLGVYWHDGSEKQLVDAAYFANRSLGGCVPGTPRSEYLAGSNNVAWAAVHSQFFTLVLMPQTPAPQIRVVQVTNLPKPTISGTQSTPKLHSVTPGGFQASVLYASHELAPGQSVERQFTIYAGPKEYKRLSKLGFQYKNNLDVIMDYEGFFGWFAQLLLSSMNGLNALGLSYALAIIAITVIIKLLFWPLTTASTRSMKRMSALQPQMRAIQDKYKDDPAKMNRKIMEFMKEHKVSPLGGCLPLLLQIPVFFGFFKMIQSAIELRGARFLWACDLSKADTLFVIPGLGGLPIIGIPGEGLPFNPLPLLMGVTMIWQARLTPPSPGMDPFQQKLMRYMPLMFLVILYNFSAGLTLYWTVQNLLTIAQMKLTKTHDEPTGGGPKNAPSAPPPGPRRKK